MICPRCSVAEISTETQKCVLCGFSPAGGVIVVDPAVDEVQETVQKELAGKFHLRVLLHREPWSMRYLARDLEADRLVTLQLLPHQGPFNAEILQQFEQAATEASALRHPHVIPVHRFGLSRSLLWYTMDGIKGNSLSKILHDSGPWKIDAFLVFMEQIASGLEYIHRRGLIHGAVRPENIYVDDDGWARLSDVALAHSLARAAGADSGWRRLLSPPYVAPEQLARRRPGPVADQFALASVARDLLTGTQLGSRAPEIDEGSREGDTATLARERLDGVPEYISAAIARAASPDPHARYASVLHFVTVLNGDQETPRSTLQPTNRPSEESGTVFVPVSGRRAFPVRIAVAVFAVAVVGLMLFFWQRRPVPLEFVNSELIAPAPAPAPAPVADNLPTAAGGSPGDDSESLRAEPQPVPSTPVTAAEPRPERTVTRPRVPETATPIARGTLFVNSRPWGVVYIDGNRVGNTPQVGLSVAPGMHYLRIVRDGYAPFERVIRIIGGEELRITGINLEPLQR
ncbi:MAG: serine/threonine protein kinase [Gemmatimonadetes bacterium]|nr:serine/threonine protein kinase [Gemmatimonadota bacterium]